MASKKLLLLGPIRSSFVQTDVRILSSMFRLTTLNTSIGRGIKGALRLVTTTLRSIVQVMASDVIYCWFADFTTLVPTLIGKLFGKKVVVVAGGFDVGWMPELHYGARARPARWFCVKHTFANCSLILPVSQHALRELQQVTEGNHALATFVYNGVDISSFPEKPRAVQSIPVVLTISGTDTVVEYVLKGLDRFIASAPAAPNVKFRVAGVTSVALECARRDAQGIPNVEIIPGPIAYRDLPALYYDAEIYCQLSLDESFGMAVIESMLCGCIPVVSNHGAPQELIGDTGLVISDETPLATVVMNIMQDNTRFDRKRIRAQAEKFSVENREKHLKEILPTLFDPKH